MKNLRLFSHRAKALMVGGLVALFGGVLLFPHTQAALGQFAITPGNSSVQNSNNVTVNLRIHPLSDVYAIDATLNYDQSKLQYVSTNAGGSAFGSDLPAPSSGGGAVHIARGVAPGQPGVTGDSYIAQVTFKALTGSGNTGLTLGGDVAGPSGAVSTTNGTSTISFTSASTPSPTPPSPSSPNPQSPKPSPSTPSPNPSTPSPSPGSPTPSPSPSSGDSADKKKISIELHKRRIEFNRATLQAIAKEKVRVYIKYGIAKEQLTLSTPLTDFQEDHQVDLPSATLVPGTTYYYKVIVEDPAGNTTESEVEDFKTKGYRLTLFVGGKNEKRLARKKVTLRSEPMTAETDANGYVTFEDVAPGNHHLEFEQDGQTYSKPVSVLDPEIQYDENGNQTAAPVLAAVFFDDIVVSDSQASRFVLPGSIAAAVVLAVVGTFIIRKRRQQTAAWQGIQTSEPPVSTAPLPTDNIPPDELVHKVAGLKKPDPGSVVAPEEDKDKDQR